MPFFIQLTVDEAIGQGDASLLTAAADRLQRGLRPARGDARRCATWVVLTLRPVALLQLGGNVVRHLLRLPLGYFERRHVGDLLSRIGSIQPIQSLLTKGIVNILIDSALLVTTLIVMAMISPPLTGIVFVADRALPRRHAAPLSRAFGAGPRKRSSPAPTRKPT